jgi:hypothetical protein
MTNKGLFVALVCLSAIDCVAAAKKLKASAMQQAAEQRQVLSAPRMGPAPILDRLVRAEQLEPVPNPIISQPEPIQSNQQDNFKTGCLTCLVIVTQLVVAAGWVMHTMKAKQV